MTMRPERQRRRQTQRANYDTEIASPCVGICQLDEAKVCVGCLRDVDEIRDWMILNKQEKIQVLENVKQRSQSKLSTVC